ncbi:hypothetical protein FWH13_03925 [Candidatus Saccharibacteria bacterium]|nr:hypothetical protein [Candidatus Saccharibacteria bacterium]
MKKQKQTVGVMIPEEHKPSKNEINVAWILARHYQTGVAILKPSKQYMVKTPDFAIRNEHYELKVLTGPQVRQLLVLLDRAKKQADHIVIDIRKTKITERRAVEVCAKFVRKHNRHRVVLITTSGVLDIKA